MISTNSATEFQQFHLRAVYMNINAIARSHTWKTMRPARCNLRAAACGILCRRPQHRLQHRPQHRLQHRPQHRPQAQAAAQAAARKLQRAGCMVFYVCVREIAFIFIFTHHASEIAGNSVALLVKIQRKLKYVQLGAACGPRQSMNQSSQLTHSTFRAACGKVWTGL